MFILENFDLAELIIIVLGIIGLINFIISLIYLQRGKKAENKEWTILKLKMSIRFAAYSILPFLIIFIIFIFTYVLDVSFNFDVNLK